MNADSPTDSPTIVWFRLDLRLADNPALHAAVRREAVVIPLFIHCPEEEAPWQPGAASCWWLHQSLKALDAGLCKLGSRLIIRRGPAVDVLSELVKETGAGAVFWNRRYEPAVVKRDAEVMRVLGNEGLTVESFNAALLHEPWTIRNKSDKPFQVFTPFWKHCVGKPDPAGPLPRPSRVAAPSNWPSTFFVNDLELEPDKNWAEGFRSEWQPGEQGAENALTRFLTDAFNNYGDTRNRPDLVGTSRLSPHLHFGELGPRQIWHGLKRLGVRRGLPDEMWRHSQFLTEIGWREFAHHQLFHFPTTPTEPLRPRFKKFPWRDDQAWLRAWRTGRTGYPIVDAGMRELWATGWMHNRVRMIVASFLVKDLLISWREGSQWFWDTLVDADLAQNTLGWQWTTGCGADAAPYFRVFNPVTQGEKFDPLGHYVSRWCPELAALPGKWIHRPARAPEEILRVAGVVIGRTYPEPIVSHAIARDVALEAFAKTRT